MKILKIEAHNIIGLKRAEIVCGQPITLIAGDNESGKSSTLDAMSMALDGKPRRVALKKNLAELLHDGAKKGAITLYGAGDEILGRFSLPKGEHEIGPSLEHSAGLPFLPLVLDPHAFARLDDKERRSTLFKLTGCSAKPDYILAELAKRGCDAKLSEAIIGVARSGFPAMVEEAKKRASEARAVWQHTTGDTWGSDKAEGWEVEIPSGPAVTAEQIEAAKADCHKTQHHIENGVAHQAKLEALRDGAAGFASKLAALQEKAALLPRAQAKLAATEKDLAQWQAEVERLTPALAEATASAGGMQCPCCEHLLKVEGGKLVEYKGAKADAKRSSDLAVALQQAKEALGTWGRTRDNDLHAIQDIEAAQRDLQSAQTEGPGTFEQAKLDLTLEKLGELRQLLASQQAKAAALQERFDLLANAEKITATATAKHAEKKAWDAIATALEPAGIPGQLLSQALDPVNTALATMARLTGWSVPAIEPDMSLSYGGRAYGLCSESARWRFDVMITLVIAQLSTLKFAMIDRLDVLAVKHRPKLAYLLAELAKLGNVDSVVLCGTMKEKVSMPAEFLTQSLWIDKGTVLSAGID